jgi:hypothetical protein
VNQLQKCCSREENIVIGLREVGCIGGEIHWPGGHDHSNEPSDSVKGGIHLLSDHQLPSNPLHRAVGCCWNVWVLRDQNVTTLRCELCRLLALLCSLQKVVGGGGCYCSSPASVDHRHCCVRSVLYAAPVTECCCLASLRRSRLRTAHARLWQCTSLWQGAAVHSRHGERINCLEVQLEVKNGRSLTFIVCLCVKLYQLSPMLHSVNWNTVD